MESESRKRVGIVLTALCLSAMSPAHCEHQSTRAGHNAVTHSQVTSADNPHVEARRKRLASQINQQLLLLQGQLGHHAPMAYKGFAHLIYAPEHVAAAAGFSGMLVGLLALILYAKERRLSHLRLNNAAHALVAAGASERTRIARELHDGVCQLLAATKHSFETACEQGLAADASYIQHLTRGLGQLEETIREIRRVTHDLKPVLPHDQSFVEAVEQLSRDFSMRTHIRMRLIGLDSTSNRILPPRMELALYRIAQEALMNIEKHASASQFELRLEELDGLLTLSIADNGRGMAQTRSGCSSGGIGLSNMRERLQEIGGTLVLRSTSAGTAVIAKVPVEVPEQSDQAA